LELLLALSLTLVLAAAVIPLWSSLHSTQAAASDHVIGLLQARVASRRLERDPASGVVRGHAHARSLIEGDARHVVVLTLSGTGGRLELVEWELMGTSLMRRRQAWDDSVVRVPIRHSLFSDHKTMLEDVQAGSIFTFTAGDRPVNASSLLPSDLARSSRSAFPGGMARGGPRRQVRLLRASGGWS